jgi:hypothetical protein
MSFKPETNRENMKAPIPAQAIGCLNHPTRRATRLHLCKECLVKWEQKKADFDWITGEANRIYNSEFDDEYYEGYRDGSAGAGGTNE